MQGVASIARSELSFLWLEITSRCNLKCAHCYADSGPSESLRGRVTLDQWRAVIRDGAALGCRHLQFIGGEPTLHPDLVTMIEAASEHEYVFIEVFTNATGLSDRLVEAFVTHHVGVATSFYSDDPFVHDYITGRDGSFAKTSSTIKRMTDAGLSVRAGIIESDVNRGHARAAVRHLRTLGVTDYGIDEVRPVGRAANMPGQPGGFEALCGHCSERRLCVTASGDVFPCVFSRAFPIGTIDEGIASLVSGRPLADFRAAQKRHATRARPRLPVIHSAVPDSASLTHNHLVSVELHGCPPNCSPGDQFCVPSASHPCGPASRCAPHRPPR